MFFGKGSSVLIPGFDSFLLRDANSSVSRLKWGTVTVLPMNLCGSWRTPPGVEESWSRELSQICNSASMSLCSCASENQNSCKFELYRAYSTSINSWNVGKLFWSWILRNCIEVLGKKESLCRVFTSSCTKHEFSHFHVVVVQWRQRNAQKSVMHVQSSCFVDLHLLLFCRFRYRRRSRYLRSGRPSLRFWSAIIITVCRSTN